MLAIELATERLQLLASRSNFTKNAPKTKKLVCWKRDIALSNVPPIFLKARYGVRKTYTTIATWPSKYFVKLGIC